MESEDRSLIIEIKKGDEKAFEQLFFKYYELLCQFGRRYVHSMHIAEEIVQDVLADVWEDRAALSKEGSFRSYLYTLVKNRSLDHISHLRVVEKYEDDVEQQFYSDIKIEYEKETPAEGFIEDVQAAIKQLPERTKQVYQLSRKDGLTYKEIAGVLDISVKTVEAHISKALRLLRDELIQYIPVLILVLNLVLFSV